MTRIFVLGPTGGVGQEVIQQAIGRNIEVVAAERSWDDDPAPDLDYDRRTVDVLKDEFSPMLEGCDAVISAIGLARDPFTLVNPPPLYTEGAVRMVQAMRKASVQRLVVISAAFADPEADVPAWFKGATLPLRRIFRQMAEMERVLRVADDIEWTAARPGWLLDREISNDYQVDEKNMPDRTLRTRRADLAHFMLECAQKRLFIQQTPFIARKEAAELEGPTALIEEFRPH